MKVREWMKSSVKTVKPRDTLAHARALLEENRINQLPVTINGRLVGIVTDRDLRSALPSAAQMAAVELGRIEPELADPSAMPVETVMASEPIVAAPDDSMESAARKMRESRIGALPIVERGHLIGILTRSDVLDSFIALAGGQAEGH